MELFDIIAAQVDIRKNILNVPTTYTKAAEIVSVPQIVGATYEIVISYAYTFDSTNQSAFFRFSINGGITWQEAVYEFSDVTDYYDGSYVFPYVATSTTPLHIILEARKETASNTMNVTYANASIKRIK
jgi:hypothetical protein